jgi:hypothetical protein
MNVFIYYKLLAETMDMIKELIIKVENLKQNKNFKEALKILKDVTMKYSDDYRVYEEIADIYLYE